MQNEVRVAILAAGLGTRMKSKKAKVLHRAGGLTLVEQVARCALRIARPENIVVVVGHQADQVREALAYTGVRFAVQSEQRGTGHALLACRELLEPMGGLVVTLYGDCPLLRAETTAELVSRQRGSGAAATLISTVLADPSGYGRILRSESGGVAGIVEQKAATAEQLEIREINSGIYCFEAAALWPALSRLEPNPASGEVYLTDIAAAFHAGGQPVAAMTVEDAGELLGINTRVELAAVDRILRERKTRELMLGGVTIERPETVTIDPDVTIGCDTVIEPFAQVLGSTAIGEDCTIGAASIVRDSTLADGVVVGPFSIIGTSRIGTGARIGPYARLRQDNEVAAGAQVGNFVELKKTRLGAGSKALHLAYLGDAALGEKVNVGAGTITCNYDGRAKHATTIGDGVFVGSNSTLVAPLEVGDGSYIAAGSVITDPVGPDTLALGRARQAVKPGWPSRRKKR